MVVALEARNGRHLQRYYKGSRQVVGCIPYRVVENGKDFEVLMISSQRKGKGMLFPKGGWENDESIEDAALRETEEEAGVKGIIEKKLGNWIFKSNGSDVYHEGHMFPLCVEEQLDSWPEKDIRSREWMSASDAKKVCQQWWMKAALDLLVDRFTSPQKQELDAAL
ncbi:hypothetical protein DCAR_0103631 [Daucus carota subsp. sativus]|uniref:Uncharacterized protein n=1 Tax=Daucus carota subsp. sativus TaxID=79200 RepID=A0A166I5E0_DAUCS|nr:PREDICTED: nudix hydrolase 17, mitochondrial-like [Daucus carota subsp. sativus]WOG84448.1 hypothetical protein DCAR_0103631 [Daucus carota subsp. sativus]